MSEGAILLLAVGLAMDAAAVSAARGLASPRILPRHVVIVAVMFGGFQALMAFLGWMAGSRIGPVARAWDHWIVFALLAGIGGKMLWEARTGPDQVETNNDTASDPFALGVMLLLAIATSIDSFAAGITLPMLDAPFLLSLGIIGATTALLSALALVAGRRLGAVFGRRLDALGGLVLIGLGVKILVEHQLAERVLPLP